MIIQRRMHHYKVEVDVVRVVAAVVAVAEEEKKGERFMEKRRTG